MCAIVLLSNATCNFTPVISKQLSYAERMIYWNYKANAASKSEDPELINRSLTVSVMQVYGHDTSTLQTDGLLTMAIRRPLCS